MTAATYEVSPNEVAEMRKLRAEGATVEAICRRLGRGHGVVTKHTSGLQPADDTAPFPSRFTEVLQAGKKMGWDFMQAWHAALDACETMPGWRSRSNVQGWRSVLALTLPSWEAAYEDRPPSRAELAAATLAAHLEEGHSTRRPVAYAPLVPGIGQPLYSKRE